MKRSASFFVYVNVDDSPGSSDNVDSVRNIIYATLMQRMSHYYPSVRALPDRSVTTSKMAFLVTVDLDPTPGTMHSKESAQNVIRNVIFQRVPRFNPVVSLATADMQPANK